MTKNFTITSTIFNEIQNVDSYSDEYSHVLWELAEKELNANKEDYESVSEYEEDVDEEMSNIININRISKDGLLYHALLNWHNRNETHNLNGYSLKVLENVRSAVLDGDYLYYVTGCGYDTISSDLLGGSADGQAKYDFLEWINS